MKLNERKVKEKYINEKILEDLIFRFIKIPFKK